MDTVVFNTLSASNQWHLILPEITLMLCALVLLSLNIVRKAYSPSFKFLGIVLPGHLLALAILFIPMSCQTLVLFGGLLEQSSLSKIMRFLFIVSSLGVSCLWVDFEKKGSHLTNNGFLSLELLATVAFMLLSQAQHFLSLFFALEVGSLFSCFLISYDRENQISVSAGIKYLVMNAVSCAVMLAGLALVYGFAAQHVTFDTPDALSFPRLGEIFEAHTLDLWAKAGVVFVFSGIGFKLGVPPFHFWIPSAYKGAPLPTTAFLAISSKVAGFFTLFILVRGPFLSASEFLSPILSSAAILSILIGTIGAVIEKNIKKLIAFSGIAHSGYLLIGLLSITVSETSTTYFVIFYVFTYALALFAVLGAVSLTYSSVKDDQSLEINDHDGLYNRAPSIAIVLAIGLASLAGIPPLAGFIAKFLVLLGAFQSKLYLLGITMLLGSSISVYFYFRWIRECFFSTNHKETSKPIQSTKLSHILVALPAFALVFIGCYQGFFK